MLMHTVFKRHLCPQCLADLRLTPPVPTRHRWYKLVRRVCVDCPSCRTRLERRFLDIDLGFATAFTVGMAGAMWGPGKPLLLAVMLMFGLRLLAGRFCSVYVLAKKQD
ncbi:hypothetical protein [Undibacterium sp. TS12]|uniref:hypothetical protein n=1 Tax=Undibacterium sp. TS12 TaxID=2908202 RepID=UPI001F4CA7D0|nr:hypothetical protein [Undibacterium sp. TS12]MCH8622808.1 hypothetical protein [Undibacterium sp. TS12]